MKNRITYMIMAAAAWFASCSQEFPADTVLPDGEVVLFMGAGPASTRTAIDLDADRGLTIAWAEADEVGIYGMSNGLPTGNNFAYVAAPAKDDPARCTFSAKDPYSMFKWINNAEQGYYA
ncbi:MAG: fimbrillin family protein, partial [Alistipes sp.]|nr:fimbrillin family protein [Alistipes sp.]